MVKLNDCMIIPGRFDYEIVALLREQEVIFFEEFGEYEGEWLLVSFDEKTDTYYIYKDSYGSCSGCDWLQEKDYEYNWKLRATILNEKEIEEIKKEYEPFIEIKKELLHYYLKDEQIFIDWFSSILPENIRYGLTGGDILETARVIYKKLNRS